METSDAEIVVLGEIERVEDLPSQQRSNSGQNPANRQTGSEADRFVRCAGLPKPEWLTAIVDGAPAHPLTKRALHNYIVRNPGCYGQTATPARSSPYYGACNPQSTTEFAFICRNTFDRGRIFEMAIEEHAADYELSNQNTFDPETRARFVEREEARNHLRQSNDSNFFYTVACMIQIRPDLAHRLLRSEAGTEDETHARQLLIGNGAPCVGYAEKVVVDGTQFRAYVAEATYSWMVAAQGKPSLLPPLAS
ncbi:hypothetical protein [Altererythrobacter sp. ZODW24]|uniref:hypothetical protein n=1 Tax=Altererythrobacter sp. ZODW24 TaxID=2185142 RepID=UPI0013B3D082|nr:hypothetical protein [Altererythrobacter sp. ZODW24]